MEGGGHRRREASLSESEPVSRARFPKRLWGRISGFVWNLTDSVPPYEIVEGTVEGKGVESNGKPYLQVGYDVIEVDSRTLQFLELDDEVKVRRTRGGRAINIDLIQPPEAADPMSDMDESLQ